MATAEASTPQPTYGTPASSSKPCTVPSSPSGPCSTGKTTSRSSSDSVRGTMPTAGSAATSAAGIASDDEPASSNCDASPNSQRPCLSMPIGTISYRSGSKAPITERAERRLTSCSPERPPKRTPTRSLLMTPAPSTTGKAAETPNHPETGSPASVRHPVHPMRCGGPDRSTPGHLLPWRRPGSQ